MNVTFAGQTYHCTKAIREGNKATLHLTDGGMVEFSSVTDAAWNKFAFEGGQWEVIKPVPSDTVRLDALEAAMLTIMGGM